MNNGEKPEHLPPPPPAAADVLDPAFVDRLTAFGTLLASAGVDRGLIGPREVPRLWERHLLNSAALIPVIPTAAVDLVDVGSGAGLPGLVIALMRPDLQVSLLEPLLRRSAFLTEAVDSLEADNVEVIRGRAEEWEGRRRWSVVTARAVAPLDRLAGWCLPLVADHGELLALKGASAADEVASTRDRLLTLGASDLEILDLVTPGTSDRTFVVRIRTVGVRASVERSTTRRKAGRP